MRAYAVYSPRAHGLEPEPPWTDIWQRPFLFMTYQRAWAIARPMLLRDGGLRPGLTITFQRNEPPLSTRIKDAGVAIRHSQGRILFYTAGSRNGLEGLGGKGVRPKFMKKEFQIIQKGVRTFPSPAKMSKTGITRHMHIQITHL